MSENEIDRFVKLIVAFALEELSKVLEEVEGGGYYDGDEIWHDDTGATMRELSTRLDKRVAELRKD